MNQLVIMYACKVVDELWPKERSNANKSKVAKNEFIICKVFFIKRRNNNITSRRQWECWEVVCQTSEHRWSLWRSCSQDGRRSSKRCQLYGPIPVSLESSESSGLLVSTASTTSSAACYCLLHQLYQQSNTNQLITNSFP